MVPMKNLFLKFHLFYSRLFPFWFQIDACNHGSKDTVVISFNGPWANLAFTQFGALREDQ